MQGRNGNTDGEDGLVDTVREGVSETNGESNIGLHTLPYVKLVRSCYITQGAQSGTLMA